MITLFTLTGYEPWLANSTCPFPLDETYQDAALDDGTAWEIIPDYEHSMGDAFLHEEDLTNLVGTFGHHALGNLTTFINESTGDLMLETGNGWIFKLWPLGNTTFIAQGVESAWFFFARVEFTLDEAGSAISLIELANDIPSRYDRDLDWNNPPPPPELCL